MRRNARRRSPRAPRSCLRGAAARGDAQAPAAQRPPRSSPIRRDPARDRAFRCAVDSSRRVQARRSTRPPRGIRCSTPRDSHPRRAPAADRQAAVRRSASSRSWLVVRVAKRDLECRRRRAVSTGVSAWRIASTIVTMHATIDANRIAAPSHTTGCRDHAPASCVFDGFIASRRSSGETTCRPRPRRGARPLRPAARATPASRRCGRYGWSRRCRPGCRRESTRCR